MLQKNFVKYLIVLFFIASTMILSGCTSTEGQPHFSDGQSNAQILNKIDQYHKIWKKTPYRYGGNSLKGIDCSGLVMNFYLDKLNMILPRTTNEQAKLGRKITDLKAGDLVFFKTGRGENGMHVGIYYQDGTFLHSSTKRGVIYSKMENSYWKSHYLYAKRVI